MAAVFTIGGVEINVTQDELIAMTNVLIAARVYRDAHRAGRPDIIELSYAHLEKALSTYEAIASGIS